MLNNIYYVNIRDFEEKNELLEKMLSWSDENRNKYIEKFRRKDDRIRSILGEAMVRQLYSKMTGKPQYVASIVSEMKDKPVFAENDRPFYFNISHSGDYVVCAVSENECGVDIEIIADTYTELTSYVCTHEEKLHLSMIAPELKCRDFFRIWTMKESYVKYIGTGLYTDMRSFSVADSNGIFICSVKGNGIFTTFYSIDGYIVSSYGRETMSLSDGSFLFSKE